jgi:cellulose synthase/poly-beta-1,6-N-acetylglucosamine synthase-like glycosyltransferase
VLLALLSAGLIVWGFIADAFRTAIIINIIIQVSYFLMIVFKMFIMMNGVFRDTQIRIKHQEIEAIDERKLPVYTILLPLYKEKNIAAKLMQNIEHLDYPKSKLDVRLLLEEDDLGTIKLVRSLDLPSYYTVLIVPRSFPRTKPKAFNYGLINARGKYTVIFDAEDKPEPDQLKKAFYAFDHLPKECICIQAKLNYYNSKQNLFTKWFTQEYSMWFELLLPGVMQLDIPLPLGGSSNHFKTDVLKNIGAWDPFNVTEDADLGIRLYKNKYKTAVLASRTWEEAPSKMSAWVNQRSRWLKGYMQTWLVHMRNPFKLLKELNLKGFIGFQVTVFGTFFLPFINPLFWIIMILWFATKASWISELFPSPIYYASLFLLIFGNFFFVYTNVVGVYWVINDIAHKENSDGLNRKRVLPFSYEILKSAIITPVYWLLMSLASYKALWQLLFKPKYWEKTEHGLYGDKYDSVGDIRQTSGSREPV